MIRFLNYISIVFRKAVSAFDLSLTAVLFSSVASFFCRDSGSLATSSPQSMNLSSTKAGYEMPLTPVMPVFSLSWSIRSIKRFDFEFRNQFVVKYSR